VLATIQALTTLAPGVTDPGSATVPGHGLPDPVRRAIVVVDIVESADPIRRNCDRVIIRASRSRSTELSLALRNTA
jgi:hypothetical protein